MTAEIGLQMEILGFVAVPLASPTFSLKGFVSNCVRDIDPVPVLESPFPIETFELLKIGEFFPSP